MDSKAHLQIGEGFLHQVLHAQPLVLGDPGGQSKPINVPANPDAGGVDRSLGVDGSPDLADVHVSGVLRVSSNAMVLLDQRIKHVGKDLVGVPVTSVDATVLVSKVNSAGNCLAESEA